MNDAPLMETDFTRRDTLQRFQDVTGRTTIGAVVKRPA
jgi:hypothetical protein